MTDSSAGAMPLWTPSPDSVAASNMRAFMDRLEERHAVHLAEYGALHEWSVENIATFWNEIWDFAGVIGEKGEAVLEQGELMPGARFFPDARLNFAENLLRRTGNEPAILFNNEGVKREPLSWDDLRAEVARFAAVLKGWGVKPGDRVAAFMPNCPETIIAMLAVTSIGAVFSSCSPDFGSKGVLDRFGQIEPKVFVAVDGYWYNGKPIRNADKLKAIVAQLAAAATVVVVPYLGEAEAVAGTLPRAVTLEAFLKPYAFSKIAARNNEDKY